MEELLERLLAECRPYAEQGQVAQYIPELAKGDPLSLGIYMIGCDGKHSWAGDCRKPFTIQSVVKPVLLLQALLDNGVEAVQSRVGVEATGKPFDAINAVDQPLSSGNLNPMVNMGAIVMCSLIHGDSYGERFERLLALTRRLAGNEEIGVDEDVYRSEKSHGSKNRALAYLLNPTACWRAGWRRCWTATSGPVPSGWTAGIWQTSVRCCPTGGGCRCPTSGFSPPTWPATSTRS